MKIPKTIRCGLPGGDDDLCHVDPEGFGSCGDGVVHKDGGLCLWAERVIEWQELSEVVRL